MRTLGLLVCLVAWAGAPLAAQTESNRYLPISSWLSPFVEHLARAGVLRGLDPLTRPLRRADVARALAAVDTSALRGSARSLVRLLAGELAERRDTVRWRVDANLALLGGSDARRWALRQPRDSMGMPYDSAGLFPEAGLAASLELPHLALVTHPRLDNRLRYDPDYTGKKDRAIAGRNDEAYLVSSWRYLDVFFGTADRNWGSPDVEGLLLSPSPYAFDHLLVRLGPRRLRLELLATQLDDLPFHDSESLPLVLLASRYLSMHRLVAMPSERLSFALSEAALYANNNGHFRSFEPWYLNPLNLFLLAQFGHDVTTSNALVAADVSYQLRRTVRLFGQLYLDDVQVDTREQADKEPPGYGFTVVASGGAMAGAASWSASYTRVSNAAYRTPANEEQYTLRRVGIARNFSDYDQITLRATMAPRRRALVSGELTYLRQGEGDLHQRFPPVEAYNDSLDFLTGVIERTVRIAAQLAWSPRDGVNLSADLGRHFITNAGHLAGASDGRWVWRMRAEVWSGFEGALTW